MKILIADKFQEKYLDELKSLGHEITLNPELSANDLPALISGYGALIVRSTKVTASTIDASDKLGMIIRAGAGYNTIDTDRAAECGVYVCNTPGKNSIAVAELAFGLMLSIDRKIPDNVIELKAGKWNKKTYSKSDGIFGKTAGILGAGEIGKNFATRAIAFGMKVLAYDAYITDSKRKELEDAGIEFCSSVQEVTKNADIISIHVPSTPQTQGMINKQFLADLKPGTILINTSRGNLINDDDLLEAIESNGIRVGLDVYNSEPGSAQAEFTNALIENKNVYGTHHIGASTDQAQNAIAAEVVEIFKALTDDKMLHPVNKPQSPRLTAKPE